METKMETEIYKAFNIKGYSLFGQGFKSPLQLFFMPSENTRGAAPLLGFRVLTNETKIPKIGQKYHD